MKEFLRLVRAEQRWRHAQWAFIIADAAVMVVAIALMGAGRMEAADWPLIGGGLLWADAASPHIMWDKALRAIRGR